MSYSLDLGASILSDWLHHQLSCSCASKAGAQVSAEMMKTLLFCVSGRWWLCWLLQVMVVTTFCRGVDCIPWCRHTNVVVISLLNPVLINVVFFALGTFLCSSLHSAVWVSSKTFAFAANVPTYPASELLQGTLLRLFPFLEFQPYFLCSCQLLCLCADSLLEINRLVFIRGIS